MPLAQIARTPRRPIPPRPAGTPYAFAVRLLELDRNSPTRVTVVRCPWCADEHAHTLGRRATSGLLPALCGEGDYMIATPTATPVLAR